LIIASIPLGFILGFLSIPATIFFGIYLIKAHHSSKFICRDCYDNNCPLCKKELSTERYCVTCKIIYCPFCKSHQPHDNSRSWFSTLLLIPAILLLLLITLYDLWVGMAVFSAYLYFSAPQCKKCHEQLYSSYLFINRMKD
jgi:1,4-dihydroxy-2-naphthoate octaprenyltransferase